MDSEKSFQAYSAQLRALMETCSPNKNRASLAIGIGTGLAILGMVFLWMSQAILPRDVYQEVRSLQEQVQMLEQEVHTTNARFDGVQQTLAELQSGLTPILVRAANESAD